MTSFYVALAAEFLDEPHEGTPEFGVADQRERPN
jgi:hypothetical protein